jgi:hypothetical protein
MERRASGQQRAQAVTDDFGETVRGSPQATRRQPTAMRISLVGIAVGLLLMLAASQVASFVYQLLPLPAKVSSRGTNLQPFSDLGPTIIRRTGLVVALSAAAALVATIWPGLRVRASPQSGRASAVLVVISTTIWYGWLGHPHNGFPSNARFHWVDYLTWDAGNFFYAAGRIPHFIFYDFPFVWNGLNAGLVAFLCYLIGRQIGLSTWTSAAMATTPAIAGNLLLFSTTAEDVMLNVLILLAVVSAALRRQPVVLGASLALAILGRPSFFVLIACVVAAEIIRAVRTHGVRPGLQAVDRRYVLAAVGTAAALTVLAQAFFTIVGNRYFLTGGRIIDTGLLAEQTAQTVDGFTISAFSGAFVGHLLWMMPVFFLAGTLIASVIAAGYSEHVESTIYLAVGFVILHMALHESQALMYYNVRYLTYTFPMLYFASWSITAHPRFHVRPPLAVAVTVALVLAPIAIPSEPITAKRRVEARNELELLDVRDDLRRITDDRVVYLDFGNNGSRNYLAYVLRRNRSTISFVSDADVAPGSIIISERRDPWTAGPPLLTTDTYLVFESSTAASDGRSEPDSSTSTVSPATNP